MDELKDHVYIAELIYADLLLCEPGNKTCY